VSRVSPDPSSGVPSPALSLKFGGSTEHVFSINKHRKVDLNAFDLPAATARKREARFSQGEEVVAVDGGSGGGGVLRRAASLAQVESSVSCGAASAVPPALQVPVPRQMV
jgi:hypothetical protein